MRIVSNFKTFLHISKRNFRSTNIKNNDEVCKIVNNCGYRGIAHQIRTDDGYILTIHEIQPNEKVEFKATAFLMHGLFRNSADFLATGPKIALPYLLIENGFQVFMGNSRGSKFCTQHVKYSHKSKEFWNFSWHEIGFYDLSAMITYALKQSVSKQTFYVGHSQGCSSLLALLSSRPEYNSCFAQVHLLAPAVFLEHGTSPAFKLAHSKILGEFLKKISRIDISPILNLVSSHQQKDPEQLFKMYKLITCKFVGKNKHGIQLSTEAVKSFNHFMSPRISAKQLIHFLQIYKNGKFQKFDYEEDEVNKLHYGSNTPPEYDLQKVSVEAYLYHAEEDALVSREGVEKLANVLPNVRHFEIVPDFNHIDVILGKDSRDVLYKNILKFMKENKD